MSIRLPLLSNLLPGAQDRTPALISLMVLLPPSDLFRFPFSVLSWTLQAVFLPTFMLGGCQQCQRLHDPMQHFSIDYALQEGGSGCGWDTVLDLCAMVPGRWNLGGINHSGLGVLDHIREQSGGYLGTLNDHISIQQSSHGDKQNETVI